MCVSLVGNRWCELGDGSWCCLYWDVIRDDYVPGLWRLLFVCGKCYELQSFSSPQEAMLFVDSLVG